MFTKDPGKDGFLGRAASFIKDKANEGKDALERRSLIKTLTSLVNLRQHTIAIEQEFGFLMTKLPTPDQLANFDLDALRALCPENSDAILTKATALEYKRVAVEQHVDWADGKIRSLLNLGGELYVSSIKACGITRSMLRPEISRATDAARARGGAIGGGSASGVLSMVEEASLTLPVAFIPEAERLYLICYLYLS